MARQAGDAVSRRSAAERASRGGEDPAAAGEPEEPGAPAAGASGAVEEYATGPFGHSVGFLLSQTGDAVSRRFRAALSELDIEPRHFAVLRAIERADNRSQQVIAETLHIPASSMVALLDQLEARRLVARHLDPHDRRVRIVETTPGGRTLLERATEIAIGVERFVCAGLSTKQREALIATLGEIAARLGLIPGIHEALPEGDNTCAPASAPGRGRSATRAGPPG